MSIPNFSHKQNKTNNNISNNTTNTLNHQDQSFDYLEWIPQSIVLLKTTFSSLLAKLPKKKISPSSLMVSFTMASLSDFSVSHTRFLLSSSLVFYLCLSLL